MSDRKPRPALAAACLPQPLFALIAVSIIFFIVVLAGSSIGSWTSQPFRWQNASVFAGFLFIPFALVLASSILLWFLSKWGWNLTVVTNSFAAFPVCIWLFHDVRSRTHWGANAFSVFTEILLICVVATILTPIFLLALPSNRREFLLLPQP